ncbi:MAG: biotin--[acetyl-CoA-carboxylase] ligase [Lachnospiraceae bacterium]|nr:biotin--[acetyl-CoA-carboxylase] ligase [Lachnospiraceae bacterium]
MPDEQLSAPGLSRSRTTSWIGERLLYFDETDSTNDQAVRIAKEGAPDGMLLVADAQTAGKGRKGRSFDSPAHAGIFMSVILRPFVDPDRASALTLIAAMAVQRGMKQTAGLDARIKWPNDIVIRAGEEETYRKLCGILTEMSVTDGKVGHVIIGIGINVGNRRFPEEIAGIATSVFLETGRDVPRTPLIWSIWSAFEPLYDIFLKTQDLCALAEDYNAVLVNRGREVRILDPAGDLQGTAAGINARGELLVQTDGAVIPVSSGEVSVRGVYGLV